MCSKVRLEPLIRVKHALQGMQVGRGACGVDVLPDPWGLKEGRLPDDINEAMMEGALGGVSDGGGY